MNVRYRDAARRRLVAGRDDGRARRAFSRARALLHSLALAALATPLPAAAAAATFEAIRAADTAIGRIGYRLATANAPLCDRVEPGLGLVLHTPSQYARDLREEAIRHFRLEGPVGVEAVIAGSPAAEAGMAADDTLVAVGDVTFASADPDSPTSTAALVDATARIAALPPAAPLEIRGWRAGVAYSRTVVPVPACRTRFEVAIGSGLVAQADGEMVQLGSRFLEEYPEDELAAAIAHELAHNVLRHRERLEAAGVSYGILAGFGRNVRFFRQTELEADILSVSLLANAGYDPSAAARFWRSFGPRHAGGILRSRSHPAWRDRVATIERAIAELGPERPTRPAIVTSRDRPLDGDWRAILVRAP